MMNVLVIGSGGREHAMVWKVLQSPMVEQVFCAGENGGIEKIAQMVQLDVTPPFSDVLSFVKEQNIQLVLVGPELPLVFGLVDVLEAEGVNVFGPCKKAADLEGSKVFAKKLMKKYAIPTAGYEEFNDYENAKAYCADQSCPIVIKADGLAAGKGVIIAMDQHQADEALKQILVENVFSMDVPKVIVEEFLQGQEASILAITDGKTILPLIPSQDHKRIFNDDKGPNTGGMGAYAPVPAVTDDMVEEVMQKILRPTVDGLKADGIAYKGVLYAGLMLTEDGPKVIEFNCRFGDPETQVVLPLLKNDLVELAMAASNGTLDQHEIENYDGAAMTVVLSSGGYPASYEKGKVINGIDKISDDRVVVFHSGTKNIDGKLVTNGGRVLAVTILRDSLKLCIEEVYPVIDHIEFDQMHFRTDIGQKAFW